MEEKNKAILFDRDGVVNYRLVNDYIKSPEEFKFIPDFLDFFQKIKADGFIAIMITNQQGIGKGIMSLQDFRKISDFMQKKLFDATGYYFDDLFYCTDLAETNSFRRKPNPGMLLEAVEKWNIDIDSSFMIGDRTSDTIAGKKAGIRTILLGKHTKKNHPSADFIFSNLTSAYDFIKDKSQF